MRRFSVIGFVIVLFCGMTTAQNTKNYTPVNMYMLNPVLINPAFSGARESISGVIMSGANWLDFTSGNRGPNYAGLMASATFDFPIDVQNSIGGVVTNNTFGVNNNLAAYVHYAFRITTGSGKLSFGLRAGINHYNRNLQKANFRDPFDPVEMFDYSHTYPNFGAGVYWYSNDYYLGISVPDFFFPPLGSELFDGNPQNYNYTFLGGYLFRFSENFKLRPSTMLTYSLNAPLAYQVNLSVVTLKDKLFIGAGYKSKGLVVMFEYQFNSKWRFGYAVEAPVGGIKVLAPHWSHEFLLRYDVSYELRTVSPAYFY